MAVEFRPLEWPDVSALVRLHRESAASYSRYFHPFPFDAGTFGDILAQRKQDLYFTVLWEGNVAGFYMLRGWDEGYDRPAYGVWISQSYSGLGVARATLTHAVQVCRSLGCNELMLKVHQDNARAIRIYETFGFSRVAIDTGTQNAVYVLMLSQTPGPME